MPGCYLTSKGYVSVPLPRHVESHKHAHLNCLMRDLWILLQKSSTVQRPRCMTTASTAPGQSLIQLARVILHEHGDQHAPALGEPDASDATGMQGGGLRVVHTTRPQNTLLTPTQACQPTAPGSLKSGSRPLGLVYTRTCVWQGRRAGGSRTLTAVRPRNILEHGCFQT
jgi:hypothetical protein